MDPCAQNAPKSVSRAKGCLSVNVPVCSLCQKLGVPTSAHESATGDISSEGEDRPSDNSTDGEWWLDEVDLNAATIGNMSIDSKPVETDGRRGQYR